MNDVLQQAAQSFALHSDVTRAIAVFCAQWLLFVLVAVWLLAGLAHLRDLTPSTLVRIIALAAVSYALAKVLNHVVSDPRPYLVEHTQPLAPVSADNGFPSDHTLAAAALTASLWWIDRRILPVLAVGTLLVMFGRLGVEAHHTLDVVGSVAIVAVVAVIVGMLPAPAAWNRPLLPGAQPAAARSQTRGPGASVHHR